jgi:uncharacterized protein (DUF305 family)
MIKRKPPMPRRFSIRLMAGFAVLATGAASAAEPDSARAFMMAMDAAMSRMMTEMEAKQTGDVDRDFVAMMTPHHQGAIDMAVAEIRFGHDERLKRIAQEIIVDQQQEIAAMAQAIGEPLPPSAPAPTDGAVPHSHIHQEQ